MNATARQNIQTIFNTQIVPSGGPAKAAILLQQLSLNNAKARLNEQYVYLYKACYVFLHSKAGSALVKNARCLRARC